jgi:hypothetical protein
VAKETRVTPCYAGQATHIYQEGPTGQSAREEKWVRRGHCGDELLGLPGERCLLLCRLCVIRHGLTW